MYWIRHQSGSTALHQAATNGHIEVTRLLLDRGADVNSKNEVSDIIFEIVMIICVCVFDCFPKLCDSNVIVIFTCHRQHCRQHECGLDNLPVCIIAYMLFLHIWAHEMR